MACLNLLGKARPLEEYTALTDLMPEWERNNRRDWTDAITQVANYIHAHVSYDCGCRQRRHSTIISKACAVVTLQGPKEFRTWVKLQNLTPYFVSAPDSALITTILSKVPLCCTLSEAWTGSQLVAVAATSPLVRCRQSELNTPQGRSGQPRSFSLSPK